MFGYSNIIAAALPMAWLVLYAIRRIVRGRRWKFVNKLFGWWAPGLQRGLRTHRRRTQIRNGRLVDDHRRWLRTSPAVSVLSL